MKTLLTAAILVSSLLFARAEMQSPIPLWADAAPGALGARTNDIPTLTPYLPDPTNAAGPTRLILPTPRQRASWNTAGREIISRKPQSNATGAAMVICPGGGYVGLAPHEGNDYALWLNQHGVTCFVLKSRLGSSGYHYPVEFEDVTRAMRWTRAHAGDYKIDPRRIGIMGSSAGGHLSSMALTHFDSGDTNSPDPVERQSSRPDLGILCYPVITMGEFTHRGSRNSLLGTNQSPQLVEYLSSELQVTSNTPPCFVWGTYEDRTVPGGEQPAVRRGAAEESRPLRPAHQPEGRARPGSGRPDAAILASAPVGGRLPLLAQALQGFVKLTDSEFSKSAWHGLCLTLVEWRNIMNATNPFQVPACLQNSLEFRRRERFKRTFIAVVSAGTLLLVGLLIEGCMNQHAKIAEATGAVTDLTDPPLNQPVVAAEPAAAAIPQPNPQPAMSQFVPAVSKVNTPPAGHPPVIYTVKSGDNLTRIAKTHATTVTAIKTANGLASDRIAVGTKLKMPEA